MRSNVSEEINGNYSVSCDGKCGYSTGQRLSLNPAIKAFGECYCNCICVGTYNCCYDFEDYCDPGAPTDTKIEIWYEIKGCTDESAINFQDYATEDDGSCVYV